MSRSNRLVRKTNTTSEQIGLKRQAEAVTAWFHDINVSISLLGQPLAIRGSVRTNEANGSTLFIFALCSSVAMVAQVHPLPFLPPAA
ncbi:hypothetical protein [Bradyrhizobium elkanii]|uniref:hypothetical protein n=1 Tax=Bradyrhizobium elkanii TaxID=29448 RepID=UPI001BAC1111|nr:hypothetical protein [Bradyrhizobium elkanii]MBR1164801.1 hypothetical protein [Bradyrhizobium elkanii]